MWCTAMSAEKAMYGNETGALARVHVYRFIRSTTDAAKAKEWLLVQCRQRDVERVFVNCSLAGADPRLALGHQIISFDIRDLVDGVVRTVTERDRMAGYVGTFALTNQMKASWDARAAQHAGEVARSDTVIKQLIGMFCDPL